MTRSRSSVRDVLALVAWLYIAYWGGLSFSSSLTAGRTGDPTQFSPGGLIVYSRATGGLLLAIALSFVAAAIARLIQGGAPLASPDVSLAIAIAMIVAFVVFVVWARVMTDQVGMMAAVLLQAPYFMAAVGILFRRRHRLGPVGAPT